MFLFVIHPNYFLNMESFSYLLLFCFVVSGVAAQDVLWERSLGGAQSEYLFDAIPTPDYGFILAGSSLSGKSGNKDHHGQGDLDYWIWKMDEEGNLEWQKSFGGSGADFLMSIRSTADGGYILAGHSDSGQDGDKKDSGYGNTDFWIIKLNATGAEEWQKTLGGSGRDVVKAIIEVPGGGYLVAGSSESAISGSKTVAHYGSLDYWIVKLDASGAEEWQESYGGNFSDQLESVIATGDGGFLIGGWSNSFKSGNKEFDSFGEGDFWVLKTDGKGAIEWQQVYGGEEDDHLFIMKELADSEYLIGGTSRSGISGNKEKGNGKGADFWIFKINDAGQMLWEETYDFGQHDILTSVSENEDGTLLLGGHAKTENTGLSRADSKGINDYIALKISADGEEIWRQTVGSSGTETLKKLVETRDGGYLLAGTSDGAISRDKNSNKGRSDFWIVKLRDKDKEEKERVLGLEAIPNPADSYTTVIVNHEFDEGTARLIDISGREIYRFDIRHRMVPVDLSGLPVGIYIVTIQTDKKTESVKILKGK